ncbi:MAG: hypothetical protein AAF654_13460 [Myxococcota bacterium]
MSTFKANDWAAFGEEFFRLYAERGIGRMPKREIDVLIFHLMETRGAFAAMSDTQIARRFKSTPGRIRSMRTDARYLYWDESRRNGEVRQVFFAAIANGQFEHSAEKIGIQVTDPFVHQAVVDLLERARRFHDTSYSRSILRIDRESFVELFEALLPEEHREAIMQDRTLKKLFERKNLKRALTEWLTEGGRGLGEAVKSQAMRKAAGWMLNSAVQNAPELFGELSQIL